MFWGPAQWLCLESHESCQEKSHSHSLFIGCGDTTLLHNNRDEVTGLIEYHTGNLNLEGMAASYSNDALMRIDLDIAILLH